MKRKRRSLKQHLVLMFLSTALLAISLLAFLLYMAAENSRARLARSAENNLELFAATLVNQMGSVESYMQETSRCDERLHRLAGSISMTDAYLDAYEIRQAFPAVLTANDMVMGLTINLSGGSLCAGSYGDTYDTVALRLAQKTALEEYLQKLNFLSDVNTADWYLEKLGGRNYLLRRVAYDRAILTAAIDLDYVFDSTAPRFNGNEKVLVYAADGSLLLGDEAYNHIDEIRESSSGYRVLRVQGQRMIAAVTAVHGLTICHLVPFQGSNLEMGRYSLLLAAGTVFVLVGVPFLWYYLRRVVFRPLAVLTDTMERIGGGELSARPAEDDYNVEFAQVNETFNRMIDQITRLKIEQYERQLEAERSKMALLKMQIRPHFILNCLKSVYALAETEQTKDIQTLILSLSGYLRYILSYTQETIPLQEEVEQCINYTTLISIGQRDGSEIVCNIDKALRGLALPPISLLTLVENSLKHGRVPGQPLRLTIEAKLLQSPDGGLADLIVRDNGRGFAPQQLVQLNRAVPQERNGKQVGLYNVLRRLQMMYGEEVAMMFANGPDGGAVIEVFLPLGDADGGGRENEAVDC